MTPTPGELRALLSDALAATEGRPLEVHITVQFLCQAAEVKAEVAKEVAETAAVEATGEEEVVPFGDTDLRILLALSKASSWLAAPKIAQAAELDCDREFYGFLRSLCERGAIDTSTRMGSRITAAGLKALKAVIQGR